MCSPNVLSAERSPGVQRRVRPGLASLVWGGGDTSEYPTSGYNKQIFRYPPGISQVGLAKPAIGVRSNCSILTIIFLVSESKLLQSLILWMSCLFLCLRPFVMIHQSGSKYYNGRTLQTWITWLRVGIIGISSISDEDWVSPNTSWLIILHNTRESQLPIIISEFQIFWSMLNVIEC